MITSFSYEQKNDFFYCVQAIFLLILCCFSNLFAHILFFKLQHQLLWCFFTWWVPRLISIEQPETKKEHSTASNKQIEQNSLTMKESFSSASSMSPGNANRKKEILYCLTALIQSYEDSTRMNRSLGSESSCTYNKNYSSSKPKSDHSIKEQETIRNVLELLHANPMPLVVCNCIFRQ